MNSPKLAPEIAKLLTTTQPCPRCMNSPLHVTTASGEHYLECPRDKARTFRFKTFEEAVDSWVQLTNKPITKWFRQNQKTHEFEFNHIEDGFSTADVPQARTAEQKLAWKGGLWQKQLCWLTSDYKVTDLS